MKFDFDVNDDRVHVVWTSTNDMGGLRHYANQNYILFSTYDVDAIAKTVEVKGEHKLEIRLFA